MKLETGRLEIIALSPDRLGTFLDHYGEVDACFGAAPSPQHRERDFLEAMRGLYAEALSVSEDYLLSTLWLIIEKEERRTAGSACFRRSNDYPEGFVEIGYGIGENCRGRGIASEAVASMCEWALRRRDVSAIIAEAESTNTKSHRVLEKCNFRPYPERGGNWWVLKRPDPM